jgi:hypothetical protein
VFDKPVMLINTLCMQGNCLLKLKQTEKAKSNFTHALNQIQKLKATSEESSITLS